MTMFAATLGLLLASALAQTPPPPPPAAAVRPFVPDQQGLAMRVKPIADGLARPERWTALRITLMNVGPGTHASLTYQEPAPLDGTGQSITYRRDVELPKGARKEVILPVRPGAYSLGVREITLETDDGRSEAEPYKLDMVAEGDTTIGVIGDDALGIGALGTTWGGPVPGRTVRLPTTSRAVRVGLISPKSMPDRSAAYGALDWIVWPQPDPTDVGPEQLDALEAWVADGGHLLVTASDATGTLKGTPLAEMLPVELTGTLDGSMTALEHALGDVNANPSVAPTALATVRSVPGRGSWTWAAFDDGRPAWVSGTYGLGTVHVILADPTIAPLKGGDREAMWRRLLFLPPAGQTVTWFRGPDATDPYGADASTYATTDWQSTGFTLTAMETWPLSSSFGSTPPIDPTLAAALHLATSQPMAPYAPAPTDTTYGTVVDYETDIRDKLNDIPGVAPLPLSWLLLFSVAYLLCIGPIDYAVLRMLGRQPLTWITFPIYITLFSGLALAGTQLKKGNQAAVVRIELVDQLPGTSRWRGTTYVGVFATRKTELLLRAGFEDAIVAPLAHETGAMWEPRVVADEGPGALAWRAETWTLAYARTQWSGKDLGGITVSKDATGTGVVVVNGGPVDIDDAQLLVNTTVYSLGPLKKGETGEFPNLSGTGSSHYADMSGSSALDLRVATTTDRMDWAMSHQALQPVYDRGLYDPDFEHPSLIAVSTAPVEPLQLTGLSPETRQITVLRVPIARAAVEHLNVGSAGYVPGVGGPTLAAGSVIKISEIHRDDYSGADKKKMLGQLCTATGPLTPADGRYYAGQVTCNDGQSYYFSKWRFEVMHEAPAIPTTPVIPSGSVVTIKELDPTDSNYGQVSAIVGVNCTLSGDWYPSSASLHYAGSATCGDPVYGTSYYFTKVKVDIVSQPVVYQDQERVRIKSVSPIDGYAYDAARLTGMECTAQGQLTPYSGDPRFHGGSVLCKDQQYYGFTAIEVEPVVPHVVPAVPVLPESP